MILSLPDELILQIYFLDPGPLYVLSGTCKRLMNLLWLGHACNQEYPAVKNILSWLDRKPWCYWEFPLVRLAEWTLLSTNFFISVYYHTEITLEMRNHLEPGDFVRGDHREKKAILTLMEMTSGRLTTSDMRFLLGDSFDDFKKLVDLKRAAEEVLYGWAARTKRRKLKK